MTDYNRKIWDGSVSCVENLPYSPPMNFNVLYAELLNSVEEAGKKNVNKSDTKQTVAPKENSIYIGHVTGAVGNVGFEVQKSRDLRDELTGKLYKLNDRAGKSSFVDESTVINNKLLEHITNLRKVSVSELRKHLPTSLDPGQGLWQCNINLYSGKAGLYWHRDDRTDGDNKPLENTFYPASATYILAETAANAGLSVVTPTREYKDANPVGLYRDPGGPVKRGQKGEALNTGDYSELSFNDCADPNTLVILKGDAYSHGIHTVNPNWTGRRISFNFRFVKECCWGALHRERS